MHITLTIPELIKIRVAFNRPNIFQSDIDFLRSYKEKVAIVLASHNHALETENLGMADQAPYKVGVRYYSAVLENIESIIKYYDAKLSQLPGEHSYSYITMDNMNSVEFAHNFERDFVEHFLTAGY
jgi:hypothetical protein